MSVARIIAPLTGAERDKQVLTTAFAAAKPFKAHVVGLFVRPDPRFSVAYAGGIAVSPGVIQEIVDATDKLNKEATKAARTAFATAASAAEAVISTAPGKAGRQTTCSFAEMEGYFTTCVSEAAKLSDLVVFGPIGSADSPDLSEAFAEILLKTERPALLATHLPAKFPGKVALAWDGSDTAARALIGALPFLEKADEVILLSCCLDAKKKPDLRAVEQYLALHGVTCIEEIIEPARREIGAALLESTRGLGVDLLVMGGYGHSRLGEVIFGGVTQHVRWHATMPVLMIH
jgi:nucleotide-binding universal stress UspA family protein